MPVYRYKNPETNVVDDYMLPVDHKAPVVNGVTLKRVYTPINVVFKGRGFPDQDAKRAKPEYQQASITDKDI